MFSGFHLRNRVRAEVVQIQMFLPTPDPPKQAIAEPAITSQVIAPCPRCRFPWAVAC